MTRQEFKEALVGKYLVTRTPSGAMTRGKVKDIFFTPVATTANVVQVRDDGKEFSTYIEEEDLEELVKEGECIRWNTKRLSTLYVIESEEKTMTKTELIALTKEVRDKIEKLRAEMTSAIDSASKTDGDVYNIPYEEDCECNSAFIDLCNALDDFAQLLGGKEVKL